MTDRWLESLLWTSWCIISAQSCFRFAFIHFAPCVYCLVLSLLLLYWSRLSFRASVLLRCPLLPTLMLFSASIIEFLQGRMRFPALKPGLLSQPRRGTKSVGHFNRHAGNRKGVGRFEGTLAVNLSWLEWERHSRCTVLYTQFHRPWCTLLPFR